MNKAAKLQEKGKKMAYKLLRKLVEMMDSQNQIADLWQ